MTYLPIGFKSMRRNYATRTLTALLLLGFLLAACACSENPSPSSSALRLNSVDLDGNSFHQDQLSTKKLIMVNIWATWCPPCIEELPELARVAQSMESEGVYLFGILIDGINEDFSFSTETIDYAKQLLSDAGATYPVVLPDEAFWADHVDSMQFVPTTLFFSPEGGLLHTVVGSNDQEGWEAVIRDVLTK